MCSINIKVVNRNNVRFGKSIFCRINVFSSSSSSSSFVFFFFNFIKNKLYIRFNYVLYCIDLFDNFILLNEQLYIDNLIFLYFNFNGGSKNNYFLLNNNSSSFAVKNNVNLVWFIFLDILNFFKKNNFGFKIKLKFLGLGFNVVKLSDNLFKFFLSSSTNIYLFVPNFVKVQYLVDEKSIIIFGLDPNYVNNIASVFLLLLNVSVYRLFGIVRLGKVVRLKIGKKR